MSTLDHSQRTEALRDVFKKHFPSLSEIEISGKARDLSGRLDIAKSFEFIERADIDPQRDQKELEAVAKALNKANKHLSKIGAYGSLALYDALAVSMKVLEESGPAVLGSMPESGLTLREKRRIIFSLALSIENAYSIAAKAVQLEAKPFSSIFSGDPETAEFRKGKPKKTAADLFSRECGLVYFSATGKEPKVPDKDGVAYGPFLDFLADAFDAVKLNASPQVWANKVDKEFSKPN